MRRSLLQKPLQECQTRSGDRTFDRISKSILITHIPTRHTIFISFDVAGAETLNGDRVCIGINVLDYSGDRDCRPDYIQAMPEVFRLERKQGKEGDAISILTLP